jgi:hypothetical protein
MDPATLRLESVSSAGRTLLLSGGVSGLGQPADIRQSGATTGWNLPDAGLTVDLRMAGEHLLIRIKGSREGQLAWPVVSPDQNVKALILPRFEGLYLPVGDAGWMEYLASDKENSSAVTEDFSMPFWGLDLGGQTVTCLMTNPFNSEITYTRRDDRLGFRIVHTFTRLDAEKEYSFAVRFGGPSPVEPARQYRTSLVEGGKFVGMADKIKDAPRVERLPGAIHAYLWGYAWFRYEDTKDLKGLCRKLVTDGKTGAETPAGRIWMLMGTGPRKQAEELANGPWAYEYLWTEVTRELNRLIGTPGLYDEASWKGVALPADLEALRGRYASLTPAELGAFQGRLLAAAFPGHFADPAGWGDGISVKFMNALKESGIDRAVLVLNDLNAGDAHPDAARQADRAGYLYGPYDSYNTMRLPGEADQWESAEFDKEVYEKGAVVGPDGKIKKGFQSRGREMSSLAGRPYVEKRVNGKMKLAPFSAWFVDCDAYGQWFDNYSEAYPATQAQDMEARIDRMKWISHTFGIPVGSEVGSGLTAGGIHFGHGMLTPCFGWGDPDLKNEKSPYWLGGYWPPEEPKNFFMPVNLKPVYRRLYDPRYRLPLYQVAFHDSVVTTHHWGNPSLKYKDQLATVALLEQLYNVPPLYHFNMRVFLKQRERVLAHYRFFSPLHRRLAFQPMTGFEWVTSDRLVQKTTFGDGTEIFANFGDKSVIADGLAIAGKTAVARQAGQLTTFSP